MEGTLALVLGAAASLASLQRLGPRFALSRAKHSSLRGHSRIAARLARLLPFDEYDEARFFRSDDAPEDVAERRRAAFMRLAEEVRRSSPETLRLGSEVESTLSDLQFTASHRAPFQYAR